jgi:hypothetical protein
MQTRLINILIATLISTTILCEINSDVFALQSAQHRYDLGYQMGCTDGPDQENYVGTGGLHGHSKDFTKGYNDSFIHGCMHEDPMLQHEVEGIISNHINA